MASAADLMTDAPLIALASVLAGSLGIPVPTFAAVVYVGSLLMQRNGGLADWALVFAAAMTGAVIGDVAWFFAGRRFGMRILGLICRLSLSRDSCVRRTADSFGRRGVSVLLFARFVPGLSVMTAPLAGVSGVSLPRFIGFAETGAAIWIGTGLALGYCFAGQVAALLRAFERFGLDLGGAAVVLALGYAGFSWVRRQQLLRRLRGARIGVDELAALMNCDPAPVVIDARCTMEYEADPFIIPGARLLPEQRELLALPLLGSVVLYCSCPNEISAAVVARQLQNWGFSDVRPLLGGLDAWRDAGHPVERIAGKAEPRATPSAEADLAALVANA